MKLLSPVHYLNVAKQIYHFVLHPKDHPQTLRTTEKIKGTWTVFAVKMAAAIILGIALRIFHDPVNQTTTRHSEELSPLEMILIGVLILPILEEVAFRLSLRFKPINLALSTSVFSYYILSKVVCQTRLSDVSDHFKERVFISIFVFALSYLCYQLPIVSKALISFWERNFRWVLYSFCIYFAAAHIFNYELTLTTILFMPLIILPKLISALCYGYIRINYGFVYSITLHLSWNLIGVMIRLMPGED